MSEPTSRMKAQGFTLVELLAALLIAAFVVLSVSNLFSRASRQVSRARDDTTAAFYSQQKIEHLMLLKTGSPGLNAGYFMDNPAPGYTRTWLINNENPATGTKLIVVTVTGSVGKPVSLVALRAR